LTLSSAIAGIVLHVINLGMLFAMMTLVKGRQIWRRWLEPWAFESVVEASLLVLAIIGAQLVMMSWWWLMWLAVPFIVCYLGFRKIVGESIQKAKLADDLENSLSELKETQGQLIQSAKLATVGSMAAGVAHEINNPLAVINGRSEMFLLKSKMDGFDQYSSSDKAIEDIRDIHEMGLRIAAIVQQLLGHARRYDKPEIVGLGEIMIKAVGVLEHKFGRKGVTFDEDFQSVPEVNVIANQIEQVFVNIIGNAIDAMPEWGTITLGCSVEQGTAIAYVKDEGIGINKELQEKIFDPFFTTKPVGSGTGLGLYICQKIIAEHRGRISVESAQGEGTTFYIELPAAQQPQERPSSGIASAI
jgi:signal transduction histidine kinase